MKVWRIITGQPRRWEPTSGSIPAIVTVGILLLFALALLTRWIVAL